MSRIRDLTRPFPPRFVAFLALAVALATIVGNLSLLGWAPGDWALTSARFREGLVLPGLVAGVAASLAATVSSRHSVVVGPGAGAGHSYIVRTHLTVLLVASWLAYTVGMVPAVVRTALQATYGGPDWLTILTGYASLSVLIILGYLVGVILPSRWVMVASPLSIAAALLGPLALNSTFSGGQHSLFGTAPVWGINYPPLGWTVNSQISISRVAYFLLLSIILALVGANWMADRQSTRTGSSGAAALTPLLLPLAISAVFFYTSPEVIVREAHPATECSPSNQAPSVKICVHQAHSALLAETVSGVDKVLRTTGNAGPFTQIGEELAVNGDYATTTSWSSTLGDTRAAYDQLVIGTLADDLTGIHACNGKIGRIGNGGFISPELREAMVMQTAVASHIIASAGGVVQASSFDDKTGQPVLDEDSQHLAGLGAAGFRAWYSEHIDQISACTLKASEFP